MSPVRALPWALVFVAFPATAHAADLTHTTVEGAAISAFDVSSPAGNEKATFADLANARTPGTYAVKFSAAGDAVRIPHCNGRGRVSVDGVVKDAGSKGPLVLRLDGDRGSSQHDVKVDVVVSSYEKRIACGEAPTAGKVISTKEGTTLLRFASPRKHADAGTAVVFVPKGHDLKKPGALLVGVHPWNGGPWTYAAYTELIEQAQARDVVLLMPSGLGNSLYVADAEDEVMQAIDAVSAEVAVDRQRVSLWGASMGGAGATTIGLHRPDRFAFVTSYFGDSKYDLTTYVRGILGGEAGAHKVNALDVVDNARHVPIWLIHGEDDHTSPIVQSTMLFDAMKKHGFAVDFDRVPGMAHEGRLVVKYIRRVVDRAATARAPNAPSRVTFRSVRSGDLEAYGVRIAKAREGDAFVDVELVGGAVVVHRAEGVREIVLVKGALGAADNPAVKHEGTGPHVPVRFAP